MKQRKSPCIGGLGMLWSTLLLGSAALWYSPSLFAGDDLKQYGQKWDQIQSDWSAEQVKHQNALEALNKQPDAELRQQGIERENARHLTESKSMAKQRAEIQDAIIAESNRRTAGGTNETSAGARKSAGTDAAGPKGRGMKGDADYGSGARTADKVEEVLKDMGIKAEVKSTTSTVEIGGDLNMTLNKEGALGRAGSSSHQTQISVDAHNKETYVSESMAKPDAEGVGGQPGRDYVQVQDHMKKAMGGLKSDPATLAADPSKAQDMVKGTTKTLDHLTDGEVAGIMRENQIPGEAADFRKQMTALKEGRAQVTSENVEQLQKVSRDVFAAAEAKTRAQADAEMASAREHVEQLEASGRTADAQNLKEQIVDSRVRMQETSTANNEALAGNRTEFPETVVGRPGVEPDGGLKPATTEKTPTGLKPGAEIETGPKTAGHEGAGRAAKVLEAAGKGMQAVDILAGAEDAKNAIVEGDMKKLRETGLQTADGLAGSPVATGKMLKERLGANRADAGQSQELARENAVRADEQEMRVEMRKGGLNPEEVERIMDARAQGNAGPLKDAYQKMGRELPKATNTDPSLAETLTAYGEEVKENTKEVGAGLVDRGSKAGKFLKDTAANIGEIGGGLTEKGVAGELVDQQKANLTRENLAEGTEHIREKAKEFAGLKLTDAEREEGSIRDLADFYVSRGIDPAEARHTAEGLIMHPGDLETQQSVREVREKIRDASRPGESDKSAATLPGYEEMTHLQIKDSDNNKTNTGKGTPPFPGYQEMQREQMKGDDRSHPDTNKSPTEGRQPKLKNPENAVASGKTEHKGDAINITKATVGRKNATASGGKDDKSEDEARMKESMEARNREIAELQDYIARTRAALGRLRSLGTNAVGVGEVEASLDRMIARLHELQGIKTTNKIQPPETTAQKEDKLRKQPDVPMEGGVITGADGSRTVLEYRKDASGRKTPVTTEYDKHGKIITRTTVDSNGKAVPAK